MNLLSLIELIDGKISIEAGIRDWKLNFEAELGNITKVFAEIAGKNSEE